MKLERSRGVFEGGVIETRASNGRPHAAPQQTRAGVPEARPVAIGTRLGVTEARPGLIETP